VQCAIVDIHARQRGVIGFIQIAAGKIGLLRRAGAGLVTVVAVVLGKQRIDRGGKLSWPGGRELLGYSDFAIIRGTQFDGGSAAARGIGPLFDGAAQVAGTYSVTVVDPAVMAVTHFFNHTGCTRIILVDHRQRLRIGRVDVVFPHELGRLSAFTMTGTTTIVGAELIIEIQLEALHILGRRGRAEIRTDSGRTTRRTTRIRVVGQLVL